MGVTCCEGSQTQPDGKVSAAVPRDIPCCSPCALREKISQMGTREGQTPTGDRFGLH